MRSENIVDSRDIVAEVEEFEKEYADALEAINMHPKDEDLSKAVRALVEIDDDEWEAYKEAKRID